MTAGARCLRTGTAGWSIPRAVADGFPSVGTGLERYANRLGAVEINTSFYRPHRRATYERWAASVPDGFRFSVKLPKLITHQRRLADCEVPLAAFAEQVAGLGDRRGPVLVQLPPSLAFDAMLARSFFGHMKQVVGSSVCEPRHPSWFATEADELLAEYRIARVVADPAPVPAASDPGGWHGLAYYRLHGSPRVYWSSYSPNAIAQWRRSADLRRDAGETWVIFDNTASGAALANALAFANPSEPIRGERD